MPAHCAALNCTSRAKYVSNGGEDEKITFHRFPIDLTLRTKWAQAMGRANKSGDLYIPTNGNYLCSLHFKKEDFDRTGQTVRLRPNTIPSNFVFPSHLQVTKNPRKTSRSRQAAQPVELALQEQDPGPSVETLCAVVQQEDKYNAMEACDSDLFESKSEPFTSEEDPEDNIDFESEAKLKSTEHIVIKEEPVDCEENSKGFTNHKGNADFEKEVKPSISELLWIKEESQQLQEMLEGVTYPEVHSDALDGQNGVNETYPNADPLDEMVVDPTYVTENETTLPSTSKRVYRDDLPSGAEMNEPAPPGRCRRPQQKWSLTPEHEQEVLEWMRERQETWRRGHRNFKARKELWTAKAESLGLTCQYLMAWWKSLKDWYVRLAKTQSGQSVKKLTDREQYVLEQLSFYSVQLSTQPMAPLESHPPPCQPMAPLECHPPPCQLMAPLECHPPPIVDSEPGDVPSAESLLPLDPNLRGEPDEDQQLEELEARAFRTATTPYGAPINTRKRRRWDTANDVVMKELADAVKTNTQMLTELLQKKPSSDREPFLTYLTNSLRNMPEERYRQLRAQITACLHGLEPAP